MLDIVSLVREKIFRRPKLISIIPGEELSEKQTTKLGNFLLFCMFFAILSSAQWTLSIIKNIPTRPTPVPSCVVDVFNTLSLENKVSNYTYWYYDNYGYWYSRYDNCSLVSTNPAFDFTEEYTSLTDAYTQVKALRKDIEWLERTNSDARYNQNEYRDEYQTSLMEKMADENSWVYDRGGIQSRIQDTKSQIQSSQQNIEQSKNSIQSIISSNAWKISALEVKLDAANDAYRTAYLLYKFYIAILSFIFAITVFFTLYKIYVRFKLKNSPHTIIFSVATFAYGIVLLQISGMFIWDILPKKLLVIIQRLLEAFTPLVYLVQFLWPVIIIAIFGFLVYKIQKRLYSPQNVLKRFITDKKCPNCGNSVDFTKPFCPLCSHEIQIHCPHCHELTLKGMPHCSNCGGKLPESDIITFTKSNTLDEALSKELAKVDTTGVSGVRFIPNGGNAFTSNREAVVKVVAYMSQKLQKTSFEPNELTPILEKIVPHIRKENIKEAELNRVLWKIQSWIATGGSVSLIKK